MKTETSFIEFVYKERASKSYLIIAGVAILTQLVLFKILYPYPNFIPDSYGYLESAYLNSNVNIWPVGYSKFVRFLSAFTHSDTALVGLQYLLIQGAILYFLFSLRYLLQIGIIISHILFIFLIFNPIFLYISNFISSDSIFTALSLVWVTQLLWILHRPKAHVLILHIFILIFVFEVRYNALYYPVVSILLITYSQFQLKVKAAGVIVIFFLIGNFIWHTTNKLHDLTGTRQFSAFGGWQMASNALYMYANVSENREEDVPERFLKLHQIVVKQKDSLNYVLHRPDSVLGIYYLWDEHAPLKQYMRIKWKKDSTTAYFKKWASMGPLFLSYGLFLIENHPMAFSQYYLLPNAINYLVPPVEFLGIYNMGKDTVEQLAKTWFGYKTNRVSSVSKNNTVNSLKFYPILIAGINLFFITGFLGFIIMRGFKQSSICLSRSILLMVGLSVLNCLFSILASPIVLRYQLFPMIICFSFSLVIVEYIYNADKPSAINSIPDMNNSSVKIIHT